MRGSWQRQTALTNNIANADTPGYQRQEVELRVDAAERDATAANRCARSRIPDRSACPTEAGPNGAGVSIDQESARLAENGLDYQALTRRGQHAQQHHPLGDRDPLMGLFDAIGIAGTGLTAERIRMDVTAENLANADTTKAPTASPTSARRSCSRRSASGRLRRRAVGRARAGPAPGAARRAACQVDGIVTDSTPDQQRLRPGQPRSRRAGLREDAERQHRHRNDRPDLRAAVLPVRRHRDADGEVDVHRDARAAQVIVPPDRRARRRRSAASPRTVAAATGPLGRPAGAGRRVAGHGAGGRHRRPAAARPSFGNALTEAISSLEKTPAERRQRLAGARDRATSATPRRRSRRSRTPQLAMQLAAQIRTKATEAVQTIFQTQV